MNRSIAGSLLGLVIASQVAWAEGDIARGETYFAVCKACHGEQAGGDPNIGSARIAGQKPWYLRRQLHNFRAGIRGVSPLNPFGLQMRGMALTLPDEQAIEDVIAYIGTLEPEPPPKTVEGDGLKGKEIFAICAGCHGERAEGSDPLNTPTLLGMADWYMVRQLTNFRADVRGAHIDDVFGRQMGSMARGLLSDEQAIRDAVAYINSLR
jgi:cytochrome c oxidase subunit 2